MTDKFLGKDKKFRTKNRGWNKSLTILSRKEGNGPLQVAVVFVCPEIRVALLQLFVRGSLLFFLFWLDFEWSVNLFSVPWPFFWPLFFLIFNMQSSCMDKKNREWSVHPIIDELLWLMRKSKNKKIPGKLAFLCSNLTGHWSAHVIWGRLPFMSDNDKPSFLPKNKINFLHEYTQVWWRRFLLWC